MNDEGGRMDDLTLVVVMIKLLRCPSQKGEGMSVSSFLCDGSSLFLIRLAKGMRFCTI
jgi:hypothetical protein